MINSIQPGTANMKSLSEQSHEIKEAVVHARQGIEQPNIAPDASPSTIVHEMTESLAKQAYQQSNHPTAEEIIGTD